MDATVFYARVSRDDLHCENQRNVLWEFAKREGMTPEEFASVYFQEEMSSRKTRPVKEGIVRRFREGEISRVVVTRIDRWARSLQELTMDVEEIVNKGGRFTSLLNGFDFEKKGYNASQQLMLTIFGAFAQFERELIRERTLEGLERARSQGKALGRHSKACKCGRCGQKAQLSTSPVRQRGFS